MLGLLPLPPQPRQPGLCSPLPSSLGDASDPWTFCPWSWLGRRGLWHVHLHCRPRSHPEGFSPHLPLPLLPASKLPHANKKETLIPQMAAFIKLGRLTGRQTQVRTSVRAWLSTRAPGCLPGRFLHHLPLQLIPEMFVRRASMMGGRRRRRIWHLSPCHFALIRRLGTCQGRRGWVGSQIFAGPS